jgi:hypothetical protein
MQSPAGARPRLANAARALVLVVACGCQAVFGDFEIASEPSSPPSALGIECEPDQYRCTNELLERCNDARTGFITVEICASAAECNSTARHCGPCTAGEYQCRGAELEHCDASIWTHVDTCAAPEACSIDSDRRSGSCATTVCDAGRHDCQEGRLVRCAPGHDHYDGVASCASLELCDPAFADELADSGSRGACRPPLCAPNEWSCEGATLRRCAIDLTDWDVVSTCDSPNLCSVTQAACAPCNPGDTECNGAELRRCDASGSWVPVKTCDAAALCDAVTGSCHAADCGEPGSLSCGRGGYPVLEVCSNDHTFTVVEACATVELCSVSAGRCLTPACEGGATRCVGQELQSCSRDRTRWETTTTCAESEVCDPKDGCLPGPCAENAVRCNDLSFERCVSGRFLEAERCETPELCSTEPAGCSAAACSPGQFDCQGRVLMKCTPGRDGFTEVRTCPQGTMCDETPPRVPDCRACTPNAYECMENDLLRCSTDGLTREAVRTCPTRCDASGTSPLCD